MGKLGSELGHNAPRPKRRAWVRAYNKARRGQLVVVRASGCYSAHTGLSGAVAYTCKLAQRWTDSG
jgi:hypothetical protein